MMVVNIYGIFFLLPFCVYKFKLNVVLDSFSVPNVLTLEIFEFWTTLGNNNNINIDFAHFI